MSALFAKYLHDEATASAHVEAMLWPDGPVCPHCGVVGNAYELKSVRSKPSKKNPEGKLRHGLRKCKDCGKQFTVRIGTIFKDSHIDLHLWLQGIYLMTSSKKGISSHQLAHTLGITVKSAWFMSHRIHEAMRSDGTVDFGADGGVVEVDEAGQYRHLDREFATMNSGVTAPGSGVAGQSTRTPSRDISAYSSGV